MSILMTEYDYATDIAVKQEEAYVIGLERGAYQKALETAKQMLLNGITIPLIVDCTNLPLETVLKLAQST